MKIQIRRDSAVSAKPGPCTSPRPCPPARCPSWVHTPLGFPRACLTNPRIFTFAHDLRSACLLSIFSTYCPSERRPLRPQRDFWLPKLQARARPCLCTWRPARGLFGRCGWVISSLHLGRALILPSAQVPGLHPELSHWGCVCPGLFPGRQPQSQESHLLIPTNALPVPGLTPHSHPETAVSGHPTQTSIHPPVLPTAGFHPSPLSGGFSLFLPVFTRNLNLF